MHSVPPSARTRRVLDACRRAGAGVVFALASLVPSLPAAAQVVVVRYHRTADTVFAAPLRRAVDSIAQAAVSDIAAVLPGVPDTLRFVVVAGPQVIDVTGEVGSAVAPKEIRWMVNPAHPGGAEGIVRNTLRKTLFHEVHHVARGWTMQGGAPPRSILDAAISEGMASIFARDVGGDDAPWAQAPADVEAWFAELQALPPSALMQYQQWMFQHPDGRRWIGYRTGAWIVDRAMARSGKTSIDLVRTPPDEVLRLAGLAP